VNTGSLPRLSIVTPSYNQGRFIAETIESVLAQEGDFEIEYFVRDGGSTDDSVAIIRRYADAVAAGQWPRKCAAISMAWVSGPDGGQSAAINEGMRRATGDVLAYLNSDDVYCPGAFARVVEAFAGAPGTDFVYGDGEVIDAVGAVQWEWLSRPWNQGVMTSYHFLWNDFTNYILQQATFWRRRVLAAIGDLDPTFHFAMDAEYWIRAGHAGLRLQHVPAKLARFRLIAGTKSLSSPTAFWEDYLEIFRRYRGRRPLRCFFAYYYYNLARPLDFDLEAAVRDGERVFARWRSLPAPELARLRGQAEQGRALAGLLLANDLERRGRASEAARLRSHLGRHPWLLLNPLGLASLARRACGPRLGARLDRLAGDLIARYRRRRFDYRYLERA
jgi:glycosyltransferase involved in cell wall biosynthesis